MDNPTTDKILSYLEPKQGKVYVPDEIKEEVYKRDPEAYTPTTSKDPFEYDYDYKYRKAEVNGEKVEMRIKSDCDYNIEKYLFEHNILDDVRCNDFSGRPQILKNGSWVNMTDTDLLNIRARLYEDHGLRIAKIDKVRMRDRVLRVAKHCDPIKETLEGLKWDGKARIDTLFADLYGAEKNAYTAEIMLLFLIGAITRVYDPGQKFDYMLVLHGKQARGKSSFFRALAEVFGNDLFGEVGEEHMKNRKMLGEDAAGKLILEYSELDGIRQAGVKKLKQSISRQDDRYRAVWDVFSDDHKRKYVIGGTTNDTTFLTDVENRRYLPILIEKKAFLDKYTATQLWAEAFERYKAGDYPHDLTLTEKAEEHAKIYRDNVTQRLSDDFAADILDFVDGNGPAGMHRVRTPNGEPPKMITVKSIFEGLKYDQAEKTLTVLGSMKYQDAKKIIEEVLTVNGWTFRACARDENGQPRKSVWCRPQANS